MTMTGQFTQQIIDLQKTSFLSLCKATTTMQKQASSAMDLVLKQVPWLPSEGRQVITDWLDTCQQESDRFNTYVEKSFANLGTYFSPEAIAKTKTPSAAKAKKTVVAPVKKAASVDTKPAKKADVLK